MAPYHFGKFRMLRGLTRCGLSQFFNIFVPALLVALVLVLYALFVLAWTADIGLHATEL
ncbi:hypothetical protein FISHEDRAFT_78618 [Fistulina hepatica ATCC 64428]|uniref:Uncharacterized protein n=1 Tax=Fistulina hepatica ATCC 64428 TaxID=1128425 RepID=A0A0D7A0F0_9AGAR|nr:hypothetical protein FISHEDRAFT_78618 [Fistulina hepatica ATCC 64428]